MTSAPRIRRDGGATGNFRGGALRRFDVVLAELIAKADGRAQKRWARDAPELDLAIPPQSCVISVFAVAVVDGKLTPFARTDVTVLGPKKPAPKPDPGPGPVIPAGARLHITIVEDPTKRTPELAKLLTSATLLQEIRKAGHVFRVYSHRDPEVVLKKLDQFVAKAGGAPALIIQTDDGVVHRSVPVPGNETAFLDVIKGIFNR